MGVSVYLEKEDRKENREGTQVMETQQLSQQMGKDGGGMRVVDGFLHVHLAIWI